MASFTDNQGRQWTVELTVGDVKRIRRRTGIDLMGLMDPVGNDGAAGKMLVDAIRDDLVMLIDLLYAILEPAAALRGVGDEDFGKALDGQACGAAVAAFWESVADFFRPLRPEATAAALRVLAARRVAIAVLATAMSPQPSPMPCGGSSGDAAGPADSIPGT